MQKKYSGKFRYSGSGRIAYSLGRAFGLAILYATFAIIRHHA